MDCSRAAKTTSSVDFQVDVAEKTENMETYAKCLDAYGVAKQKSSIRNARIDWVQQYRDSSGSSYFALQSAFHSPHTAHLIHECANQIASYNQPAL